MNDVSFTSVHLFRKYRYFGNKLYSLNVKYVMPGINREGNSEVRNLSDGGLEAKFSLIGSIHLYEFDRLSSVVASAAGNYSQFGEQLLIDCSKEKNKHVRST